MNIEITIDPTVLRVSYTHLGLRLQLEDWLPAGPVGGPDLPARTVWVALPAGYSPSGLRIASVETVPVSHEPTVPAPLHRPRHAVPGGTFGSLATAAPVPELYARHRAAPPPLACLAGTRQQGDTQIAMIELHPVFQADDGSVHLAARLQLILTLICPAPVARTSAPVPPAAHSQALRLARLLRASVINPEAVLDPAPEEGSRPGPAFDTRNETWDYLVITDDFTWNAATKQPIAPIVPGPAGAFASLVSWKNQLGFHARVVTVTQIVTSRPNYGFGIDFTSGAADLQAVIRKFLAWAHAQWHTAFVLLGGDQNIVPIRRLHNGKWDPSLPTDFYYADLDPSCDWSENQTVDLFAVNYHCDLSVGRAPVTSLLESSTFVAKVMAYEGLICNGSPSLDWLRKVLYVSAKWGGDSPTKLPRSAGPLPGDNQYYHAPGAPYALIKLVDKVAIAPDANHPTGNPDLNHFNRPANTYCKIQMVLTYKTAQTVVYWLPGATAGVSLAHNAQAGPTTPGWFYTDWMDHDGPCHDETGVNYPTNWIIVHLPAGSPCPVRLDLLLNPELRMDYNLLSASGAPGDYREVPYNVRAGQPNILPGPPVAQGQWGTIRAGHELIALRDGRVLDWVPPNGTWRLWNYNPGNTNDVLPGSPVAQGQWGTIGGGHRLIAMRDGRVLDWVPTDGTWRLWNYNPANTSDILPGSPVAQGQWSTIRTGHILVPMIDGRVLDWVPSNGTWRLWNYDPNHSADVLPGVPVARGRWGSIRTGHTLVPMLDGRVLDWVPANGTWRLWNYNPTNFSDVLPGNPVSQSQWATINTGHALIPMRDGRMLDWVSSDGTWRLWNYSPYFRTQGWCFALSSDDPRPSPVITPPGSPVVMQAPTPWLAAYGGPDVLDPAWFVLDPGEEADTMVEEERLRKIMQTDFPEWNQVSRLYPDVVDLPPDDRYLPGTQYYSRDRLIARLNQGQHIISMSGHGLPWSACAYGEGGDFNLDVADVLTNVPRCGILFSDSCLTNRYTDDSLSKHLVLKNNHGGLTAYVGCMDEMSIGLGGSVKRKFFHDMALLAAAAMPGGPATEAGAAALGLAFDARIGMLQAGSGFDINSADVRYTIIMLSLLGDPGMRVHTTLVGEG